MNPSNSLKRTKIRPPRKIISILEVDFNKSWEVLGSAIAQIQQKNSSNLSFEELYRTSYNLVLRKYGKLVYKNVTELIRTHLEHNVRVQIMAETQDRDFLVQINRQWQDHLLSMRMISDVLMYLDRVYSKENRLPLIYDVGLNLFQECIVQLNEREIGEKVTDIVIREINKNRDSGILIDKFLIKSIICMFETLVGGGPGVGSDLENYYVEYFEPVFLLSSKEFYESISKEIVALQNGGVFLTRIDLLIKEEEQRIVLYLPDVTLPKLIDLMNRTLIANNLLTVLKFENEGLRSFITTGNYAMLGLVYTLGGRYDSDHTVLKLQLKEVLIEAGHELLKTSKAPEKAVEAAPAAPAKKSTKESLTQMAMQWVLKVLEVKDMYERTFKECFKGNERLLKAVDDSVSEVVNLNPKVSEYLSLFIDDSLKRAFKNKTEEECELVLDKSIVIFRYIKDKDLFEKYYKNHLAKRLLSQKTSSIDLERVMISKFKLEIGPSFTSNLEGMFRDIKISKDLLSEFKLVEVGSDAGNTTGNTTGIKKKISLEVSVLTSTAWPLPLNKDLQVHYPQQMVLLKDQYEQFYLAKHNARTLHWAANFGNVDLRMRYKKRLYEINMSTYAAIIVMLFDGTEPGHQFSYREIAQLTNIPKLELVRQLQSVAVAPRTRLLTKTPMSKDIKDEDLFSINENFSSPQTKLKVFTVSMSNRLENDAERSKTLDSVDQSRRNETDAAIVRIMKARKTLKHNELLNETIKQVQHRFKPPPSLIKQRIEMLLEREYLERDGDDRTVYNYLA